MSYFTPSNFPNGKQDDTVREAYIELRLRNLLALTGAKQCAGAATLEAPDPRLPFTAGGFADITKGARFQYLLGVVEAACGNEAAARARWERVSKMDAGMATTDYAYPLLALAKLDPNVGRARSRTALGFLAKQVSAAAASHQGALLYARACSRRSVTGRSDVEFSSRRGSGPSGNGGVPQSGSNALAGAVGTNRGRKNRPVDRSRD